MVVTSSEAKLWHFIHGDIFAAYTTEFCTDSQYPCCHPLANELQRVGDWESRRKLKFKQTGPCLMATQILSPLGAIQHCEAKQPEKLFFVLEYLEIKFSS